MQSNNPSVDDIKTPETPIRNLDEQIEILLHIILSQSLRCTTTSFGQHSNFPGNLRNDFCKKINTLLGTNLNNDNYNSSHNEINAALNSKYPNADDKVQKLLTVASQVPRRGGAIMDQLSGQGYKLYAAAKATYENPSSLPSKEEIKKHDQELDAANQKFTEDCKEYNQKALEESNARIEADKKAWAEVLVKAREERELASINKEAEIKEQSSSNFTQRVEQNTKGGCFPFFCGRK